MRKTDIIKACRNSKFHGKKIWRIALYSFQGHKGARYIRGNVYFGIIVFSYFSSTKPCLRFILILFCSGYKRLLLKFLRKWGWFRGHNERIPKYFCYKLKFQKTETRFFRWKSTDNDDINIFLSLGNPCTFLLAKEKTWKRIFNTNSELYQNRIEKHIMPFKTTVNWLFNDIWCYLLIACFDWKIGVFQQCCNGLLYP